MRATVGLVLALALVCWVRLSVAAETPTPYAPLPGQCTIAPRTIADLERILATATAHPPPERPKSGDPIGSESATGQAVNAVITELFACLNAGDRLRSYALYTDAFLATILQPADLESAATPSPVDKDDYTRIGAIELHALAGERVLAKVTLDPALIPVQKIFEFILVPVDGQWRIDAVINEIDFAIP